MNVQGPIRDVKKFVALSQDAVEKASKELRRSCAVRSLCTRQLLRWTSALVRPPSPFKE
jgi:hypothetical protein